jgi:hypothetical protein
MPCNIKVAIPAAVYARRRGVEFNTISAAIAEV